MINNNRILSFYDRGFSADDLEPVTHRDDYYAHRVCLVSPVQKPTVTTGGLFTPEVVEAQQQHALLYLMEADSLEGAIKKGDYVILRNNMLELTHPKCGVLVISSQHILAKVKHDPEQETATPES